MGTCSASNISLPAWGGKLDFRKAKASEVAHLKELYEKAWGKGITIGEGQLRSCIRNFPAGQIVGVEKGTDTPVSMINIMLTLFEAEKGFAGGYEKVTGNRTFSTSIPPKKLAMQVLERDGKALPIAFCVSIAVPPAYAKAGYANETLNYAIAFASSNGLIAAPYSAPRGFAKARKECPGLDIIDYLHMTIPRKDFFSYLAKISVISPRLEPAFGSEAISSRALFDKYYAMGPDVLEAGFEGTAYRAFLESDDCADFFKRCGRLPAIEDFAIRTGRMLIDPVIGMHVANGARFIRDGQGNITAVFPESRPEDQPALGYNLILSYGYHPLLGHLF